MSIMSPVITENYYLGTINVMRKILEKDIQLAICDYLSLKGHFFWRQNTTAIFERKTNSFRPMPKYSMNGIPDIIVIRDGFFIGLEVKQPKGKQSENQKIFEKLCKENGAEYYVVTSIDDVQNIGL